jgi:hypothetical protein
MRRWLNWRDNSDPPKLHHYDIALTFHVVSTSVRCIPRIQYGN